MGGVGSAARGDVTITAEEVRGHLGELWDERTARIFDVEAAESGSTEGVPFSCFESLVTAILDDSLVRYADDPAKLEKVLKVLAPAGAGDGASAPSPAPPPIPEATPASDADQDEGEEEPPHKKHHA